LSKQTVIHNKKALIEWVSSLKNLSMDQWFKPLREGGWGTADVISHFISWDRFIMNFRLKYLLKEENFPNVKIDVQDMNDNASVYARSGVSKEDLIDTFISVRTELITLLNRIPDEKYDQPCPGKEHITLCDYFMGLVEHDEKHKEQIESILFS
jgi:hypothetical protein